MGLWLQSLIGTRGCVAISSQAYLSPSYSEDNRPYAWKLAFADLARGQAIARQVNGLVLALARGSTRVNR